MAIFGSCVAGHRCLTSSVLSNGSVGGGVSLELSVGDVGKSEGGNTVLALSPTMRILSRSPVFWRVWAGVGVCGCCDAADSQVLVGDAVADPE